MHGVLNLGLILFFVAHLTDKQRHFQADEREPDACALAAGLTGFLLRNLIQATRMWGYST